MSKTFSLAFVWLRGCRGQPCQDATSDPITLNLFTFSGDVVAERFCELVPLLVSSGEALITYTAHSKSC